MNFEEREQDMRKESVIELLVWFEDANILVAVRGSHTSR